jgi:two-component system, NtrC family, response regulator GlrR
MSSSRNDADVTAVVPAVAVGAGPRTTQNVPTTVEGRQWAHIPRCRLVVLSGPDQGRVFALNRGQVVIGAQTPADVVLSDSSVSRFHCELTLGQAPVVRDLGSRNGTFLDGVRVVEAVLHPQAVLELGHSKLRFEYATGEVHIPLSDRVRFGGLVGQSAAMRAAFAALEQAASSDVTALIEGDTGTGKEASAEGIHRESRRREGPFIVVDCGALPPQLLESELFGHERGSFTGAVAGRKGAFEAAHGGTIFLDEIGELSLDLQPKLLRALERKEVKPVGSNFYRPADVRVVAATNRNLRAEVTARRFRADLYFRLAVLQIRLPPLRDRLDDLPLLIDSILESLGAHDSPQAQRLRSEEVLAELRRHPWRGNVRELRNHVERYLVTRVEETAASADFQSAALSSIDEAAGSDGVPLLDADADLKLGTPLKVARERWIHQFERSYLAALLEKHNNRVSAAARAAGVDRIYFYRLLWKYGLRSRESGEGET